MKKAPIVFSESKFNSLSEEDRTKLNQSKSDRQLNECDLLKLTTKYNNDQQHHPMTAKHMYSTKPRNGDEYTL